MDQTKAHIFFKGIVILLITSFLLPSIVKVTHIFENHKHEVCETPQKSHYHSFELDCEFYKFNLNPKISLAECNFDLITVKIKSIVIQSQYQSLSKFQRLSFSLRGPPGLV